MGRAIRAICGPTISGQRTSNVASLNPARAKASLASLSTPSPAARAQPCLGAVCGVPCEGVRFALWLIHGNPGRWCRIDDAGCRKRVRLGLLLAWYDVHRRELPWRSAAGKRSDPYRSGSPRSCCSRPPSRRLRLFPHLPGPLAGRRRRWPPPIQEEVLESVGRARLLLPRPKPPSPVPQRLAGELGGRFPAGEAGLRALPGVGPYTAAAIAAIAFDQPALAGRRQCRSVIARLFAIETRCRSGAKPRSGPRLVTWRAARRRLRPGDDGSRRHDVHPPPAGLRDLSRARLHATCAEGAPAAASPRRAAAAPGPERRGAAGCGVRRACEADGAMLSGASGRPSGSAGRHGRGADQPPVDGAGIRRRHRARRGAVRGRLAAATGWCAHASPISSSSSLRGAFSPPPRPRSPVPACASAA